MDDLALFDQVQDAIIVVDTTFRILRWSRGAVELYGWGVDEAVGQLVSDLMPVLRYMDGGNRAQSVERLFREGLWTGVVVQRHCNGQELYVESSVRLVHDAAGRPARLCVINRDVSERVQAANQLRESEARFRAMANSAPVLIWLADTSGAYTFCNQTWLAFTGRTLAQELGAGWTEGVHPDDLAHCIDIYRQALTAYAPFKVEYRLRHADGSYRWMLDTAVPRWTEVGAFSGHIGSCVDITERHQAEEAHTTLLVREQAMHQRLKLLADLTNAFMAVHFDLQALLNTVARSVTVALGDGCALFLEPDPDGPRTPAALALRQTEHEHEVRAVLSALPPDHDSGLVGRVAATGQPLHIPVVDQQRVRAQLPTPLQPLLDRFGLHSYLAAPLRVEGQVLGVLAAWRSSPQHTYAHDDLELLVSIADRAALVIANARLYAASEAERAHANEALARLDTILAAAPVGICFWDSELRYVRLNHAFAALNGSGVAQHLGKHADEIPPGLFAEIVPELRTVLATGTPIIDREVASTASAGTQPRHWLMSFYAVRDPDATIMGVGAIVMEITARKRLEAQLLQAQKMESIGRLAGGIAHDFNNLLTAISGYADLARAELDTPSSADGDIAEIQRAATRASGLTRQLLAFARKQLMAPLVIDINALVRDLESLLRRIIGEHIIFTTRLEPHLNAVRADGGQIEQVLINLAVNACDAMPHGGQLLIETANVALDPRYAHGHAGVKAGPYVLLTVTDTGSGMDLQTREQAFEPFFTTKALGKGTGLGLATCYGIVKQHNGNIWIYSEPGHGTTIKVYLPSVDEALALSVLTHIPAASRGSETILLAEDEEAVRQLAARVLRAQGYTVLEASNGSAALRVARAYAPAVIHLLLTDVIMPEMGGPELAAEITRLYGDIRVLYTSGYTDKAINDQGAITAGIDFLPKPFAPADLAQRVRAALDSSPKPHPLS